MSLAFSARESEVLIWPPRVLQGSGLMAVLSGAVFDGDNVFLHGADRISHGLEQSTGSKWKGAYFMPAQADRYDLLNWPEHLVHLQLTGLC